MNHLVRTNESTVSRTTERGLADQMVPRVSTMIANGALLQDRQLQVSENGEVRWVSPVGDHRAKQDA